MNQQDDRLGPYKLLRRLGEGGMGVVHLAVDPQGRQVAVKVLRPEVAGDDLARRRLSREVETLRLVRSEHIAEVLDADVTGLRPYIVTRYVAGDPLDDVVKRDGALDLQVLLQVAYGVAAALAAVHEESVIHRDLKPGNVLILDGKPVLIDFGIAQAVDATRLTQTGMFIGTPGYLAPEIIEGHEAGPEVDVHAWAGTLLYAATGQPPFGKGTLEMIFYNITAGRANVDAAPPVLQPLLRAALQRDPKKRPKATDLAAHIARLMPRPTPPRPGAVRVPDEIITVPEFDSVPPKDSGDIPTPRVVGPRTGQRRPPPGRPASTPPGASKAIPSGAIPSGVGGPAVPAPPDAAGKTGSRDNPATGDRQYVSLLGDLPADAPQDDDQLPTRRVTTDELRQVASGTWEPSRQPEARDARSDSDVPTLRVPPAEGDVPTTRVRSQELPPEYFRSARPPDPAARHSTPPHAPVRPAQGGQRPAGHQAPSAQTASHAPPYPPQQGPSGTAAPYAAGRRFTPPEADARRQGVSLRRSRAYGVATVMLAVIMVGLAVVAPVLVAALAIPVSVLLRAADLDQPTLNARRPVGEAAGDVIRVLGRPGVLARSAGITAALVPYALVLGLPVTLLLAVLVNSMPVATTLNWGAAVALWTLCAGPGVEGPSRQMKRTLASLLPARTVAVTAACALAALAGLILVVAAGVVGDGAFSIGWTPIDVGFVIDRLEDLRWKAAG
ncbi:serine/threonine-protein kinase [Sinosporangium siamense]|nr:serine/threonine-protein kinase [Sinosporangium siamense]